MERILTIAGGDILSIDYMLLGSIQSFKDEEILSESKDAFMYSKAKSLAIGSLSSCATTGEMWIPKSDIHPKRLFDKSIYYSDQRLILIMIIRNTRHCLLF